jgi:AraC-like DNA-binding protein
VSQRAASKSRVAEWRRRTYQVLTADVLAGRASGPVPAPEWACTLHRLTQLARTPVQPPLWWTLRTAYCGSVETRTDPASYHFDGMHRPGPEDPPLFYCQLGLAGWGHFELYGKEPEKITPGKAFFAIIPSRHRYYLPQESPGWTFAWIGVHLPPLVARVTKQVKVSGPLLDVAPDSSMARTFLRLVRGAIKKDFRDQYEVELALWEFVLAFERWGHESRAHASDGDRLLEILRARIIAALPRVLRVHEVAAEHDMSRSHFSHHFRALTGLTPAHYSTEVRVNEAIRMLRETREPLKSIADACGFANANHFCKVFRRYQHVSPLTYRRTLV